MTLPPNSTPPTRSSLADARGCLLTVLFFHIELVVGIVVMALVADAISPSLAARGYNIDIGNGFLIAWGLGAVIAIYPVIWTDRLRRRCTHGRIRTAGTPTGSSYQPAPGPDRRQR